MTPVKRHPPEVMKELVSLCKRAGGMMREGRVREAEAAYMRALEIDPEDGPSKLYVDRCEMLMKNPPPADWDGVFTMTTK